MNNETDSWRAKYFLLIGLLLQLLSNLQTNKIVADAAVIFHDVHPKTSPLQGGTVMQIIGLGLTTAYNPQPACQLELTNAIIAINDNIIYNDTYMTCTLPAIISSDHISSIEDNNYIVNLQVTGASESINILLYDLDSIQITGIFPTGGLVIDETLISIYGFGFVNTSEITCNSYGYSMPVLFVNSSHLMCHLPTYSIPSQVLIKVYLNGQFVSQIPTISPDVTLFTYYATPPQVIIFMFTPSYAFLHLEFDREIEIGGEAQPNTTRQPDCHSIFSNDSVTILGHQATCSWLNSQKRQVVVALFNDTNVLPNSSLTLNSTNIRTRYVPFSKLAQGDVMLQENPLKLYPIASIVSPQYIPYCGNLTLDASGSQHSGPKPLHYLWNISVYNSIDLSGSGLDGSGVDSDINVALSIADYLPQGFTSQAIVSLPTIAFTTNTEFTITVTVQNFLGFLDLANVTLSKATLPLPNVWITGSTVRTVNSMEEIIIEGNVEIPDCINSISILSLNWEIRQFGMLLSLTDLKLNSPLLQLPANTLSTNSEYLLTLYASSDSISSTNASLLLRTQPLLVQALILGGSLVQYGKDDNIILDLSCSYGLNEHINTDNTNWTVSWYCSHGDATCNDANGTNIMIEPYFQTYIPGYTLTPGLYVIEASIHYQTNLVSIASQTVHILDSESGPSVYLKWPKNSAVMPIHRDVVITGIIVSDIPAAAQWSSVYIDGYAYLPLETQTISTPISSELVSKQFFVEFSENYKAFLIRNVTSSGYWNPISLVIPPALLLPNNAYRFRLSITDVNNINRYAEINIKTASMPSSGTLEVTPMTGLALLTDYTIRALYWTDDIGDTPLYYRFGFLYTPNYVIWLTSVTENNHITCRLPLLFDNTTVDIVVEIYDNRGALTVFPHSITTLIPTHIIDIADLYNDLHILSIGHKKWDQGLASLTAILSSVASYLSSDDSVLLLNEPYIKVFKQSCVELVTQLFVSQLPLTKTSCIQVLQIYSMAVTDIQLPSDTIVSVLQIMEIIVNTLANLSDREVDFAEEGVSSSEAQIIVDIYGHLLTSNSQIEDNRVLTDEITRSYHRIIHILGLGLCQQLSLYESSVLVSNSYLGTLKAYYTILPWTLNATCSNQDHLQCPFSHNPPSTIVFGSSVLDKYIKIFCHTRSKLGNFTECDGVCIVTAQLVNDIHWPGNPYADHIITSPVNVHVTSKDGIRRLLEPITFSLLLSNDSSENGQRQCVYWNNNTFKWSNNNCQMNKLSSQVMECTCNSSSQIAVIDHCPSGLYGIGCTTICPQGLWGKECSNVCQCNYRGTCSPIDGSCDCIHGWIGDECQTKCDKDHWGKDCLQECFCDNGECHHVNGGCDCSPGWIGTYCNMSCPSGLFGKDCNNNCTCRNDTECDKVSGLCACQTGYTGLTCHDICPYGLYGNNCNTTCDCHLNGTSSCHHITGSCECIEPWFGTLCDIKPTPMVSPTIMTIQDFPFWSVSFPVILLVVVVILIIIIIVIVLWKKNKKRKKVLPISGEKGENKDATDVIASMEENIDGEEDELQITRAHSLVHIHGKNMDKTTHTGAFKEPDKLGTKLRWQIIQLIPDCSKDTPSPPKSACDKRSKTAASQLSSKMDDDIFSEKNNKTFLSSEKESFIKIEYWKGVYLEETATLKELRNEFIDSDQLEEENLFFQFLQSDTPGDFIPIDNEEDTKLTSVNTVYKRTIYIERIDKGSTVLELCVCGKFAELECTECQARGYCSEKCQEEDWPKHVVLCRVVSARRRKDERRRKKQKHRQKKIKRLLKSGYTPTPNICQCGKDTEYECSICGRQGYCSKHCQEQDWENHKLFCVKESIIPSTPEHFT